MTPCDSVYVLDDDSAVLNSVEALLSARPYAVQCFASAPRFLEEVDIQQPACLISDVQMPLLNGLEILDRLRSANSPISTIVVTGVADVPMAVSLMEKGAITLLEKPYDQNALLNAVERALTVSHRQWQQSQAEKSVQERLDSLDEDERSVIKLMIAGEPNKGIASKLCMSLRTVDRRRQSVLRKMRADSVPQLALILRNFE